MPKQAESLYKLIYQLEEIAQKMERDQILNVGYRERITIERPLFLILKKVCICCLSYELQGLTEVHRIALLEICFEQKCSKNLQNFVRQVFELRVLLINLSSANPYVQEDSLSRLSLTKRESVAFIIRNLRSLVKKGHEIVRDITGGR